MSRTVYPTAALYHCTTCDEEHADYRHDAFPANLTRMARNSGAESVYSACEGCGRLLVQAIVPARLCTACSALEG